jgi:hypothetical protein
MGHWFAKRDELGPTLEPGSVYRNVRQGNVVETAKVLAVTRDGLGIPHVRFDVTLDSPGKIRLVEGRRILCLAAFAEQFKERVTA